MKFFLFVAASLFLVSTVQTATAETCDQCQFDENDAADCKVYGQIGDGVLIPYFRASQECLDNFNIKVESISPTQLLAIFPNADGSGGSVTAFVNYLRFEEGSVANNIKLGFPQFWGESDTTPGIAVLLDEIVVDGTTYDCEASESDCYTAMRSYFETEPGASEMKEQGRTLHNLQKLDREKEQSTVRIRLCQEGDTPICDPLSEQVQGIVAENPDMFCSALGLGPAGATIPGCQDDSGSDPTRRFAKNLLNSVLLGGTLALVFW